jgi:hypothetical protein
MGVAASLTDGCHVPSGCVCQFSATHLTWVATVSNNSQPYQYHEVIVSVATM